MLELLAGAVVAAIVLVFLFIPIPIVYNLRSVRVRWVSAVVAVLGVAGTVGVFIAMMSLARGFQATLVRSGSAQNALVVRAGATAEMMGVISLDQVKVLEDAPGVARSQDGPLVSPEVVVVAAFPLRTTGADANVQIRGVSPDALQVRNKVKIVEGRFFRPGLNEIVVGHNAAHAYSGLTLGNTVKFGGVEWRVVGIFDSGGTAFDSEVWCDAPLLDQAYKRPTNIFQSATVHLDSPDTFQTFKDAVTKDPRMTVDVSREVDYYEKQSRTLTTLITVLGTIVAVVMGIGAVFGALNTMYSAVAERSREIATMRALGFGAFSVVISFMIEALLISFCGGALGCLAVLRLNGYTTGAMNWQTFSHLAFAFKITPNLLIGGIVFALFMGLLGGLPPAVRAARRPVAASLRAL
jgi:putative ABC transport system permease protein